MSAVLLIPLAGPMQSWGTRSRFQERDTEREPTKSGVIGLMCAALGRDRAEPLEDLAPLIMGVRVDREGALRRDFQTAQGVAKASGQGVEDQVSTRHYLADAAFLVAFQGESELLRQVHAALARPRWSLGLGRRSYVPAVPPFLPNGLRADVELRPALLAHPLARYHGMPERVRLVLESATPTHESRMDAPISFAHGRREFRERFVTTEFVPLDAFPLTEEAHDVPLAADA